MVFGFKINFINFRWLKDTLAEEVKTIHLASQNGDLDVVKCLTNASNVNVSLDGSTA